MVTFLIKGFRKEAIQFYKQKYRLNSFITLFSVILFSAQVLAQTGSITGKITDKNTNEILIGANIVVAGTKLGASSDIDGAFQIHGLKAGTYQLKVSFISYQTVTVEGVKVEEGKPAVINVSLSPVATELSEVVVTAEALQSTETSVLKIQKNSENIVDGLSAELISKNNSSDGTDVLKRMTGVTISDGKYAFIRGIGDRYNNTLLNGANLPSTDPEKRSFSYDLIPASLIENVMTSKTFTPDKPADFSGGLVEINTVEFPSQFLLNFSTSAAYNTASSFDNAVSYSGGKTDFLGIDDGTRDLPSTIGGTNLNDGFNNKQLDAITRSFKNDFSTKQTKVPLNSGYNFTIGNGYEIGGNQFGFIGALSYSTSAESKNVENNSYSNTITRFTYQGPSYTYSAVLGGLLNLSYKFNETNKISLKNIYNHNSDDETILLNGNYQYAQQYRSTTAFRFVERTLFSSQLLGEHQAGILNGANIKWNLSYGNSKRNEPDARKYTYSKDEFDPADPMRFMLDPSLATRYYGNLDDNNYAGNAEVTLKLFANPDMPNLKTGFAYDKKKRDFSARIFGYRNGQGNLNSFTYEQNVLLLPVGEIFAPENIDSSFITIKEMSKPSDSYNANQDVQAGFVMTDFNLFSSLRIVTGARYERSEQKLSTKTQTGGILDIDHVYNDVLPSLNITYRLNEEINIRLGYSKTLARPEFRELATFSYYDFSTGENVEGNPDLKRALINNYDFRFELFSGPGELFAASFFYKMFTDPIEQVLKSASAFEPTRTYANGNEAKNYGLEFELRKNLGFISDAVSNLNFVGNLSLIKSKIRISDANSIDGTTFQKTERPLQGQADYIINTGLYYDNPELGLSASLIYNKVGQKINKVGFDGVGDVIEVPRDQVDFSIGKKLFQVFSVKLTVKDLLAQDYLLIQQQTPFGDQVVRRENRGRNISLGLTYQL